MLDDFCCIPRFTKNLAFVIENLLLDADTISGIQFFLHLNTVVQFVHFGEIAALSAMDFC